MSPRPEEPTRALAWLYSPQAQRPVLEALLGIEREVNASLAPGLDHEVAHARLAWWREELARAAQGTGVHPLTRSLQESFAVGGSQALAGLRGLADAATWDLAGATFETRRELEAYSARWSAALIGPLAYIASGAPASAQALTFGSRLREIELLENLLPDARAGRIRLTLDELEQAQLRPEQIARPPWSSALGAFVAGRQQQARAALATSVAALPAAAQPGLRGLLVWAALLQRRARSLPGPAPAGDHHAPLDGWRAWRAARRADAGRLALGTD